MLRDMIASNHLPDYNVAEVPGDKLCFRLRDALVDMGGDLPVLSEATLHSARAAAPGYDIYALEADWRAFWVQTGRPRLRKPDAAFLGFVAARVKSDKGN